MAEQYACQQFLNDDIIIFIINTNFFFSTIISCNCWRPLQMLIPSDLPISLPANNIPEQREKLAVLVSTGKSKKALPTH